MSSDEEEIDTFNKFMVAAHGDGIILLNGPRPGTLLSMQDALLLAAYLVALTESSEKGGRETFDKVYEAVCNT